MKIRKLAKWLAPLAVATALTFGAVPAAHAAPSVFVGPGTLLAQTNGLNQYDPLEECTMTAVGHDNAGRLVGLTAGHCATNADGSHKVGSIYKVGVPTPIGQFTPVVEFNLQTAGALQSLDYAIVTLDPSVVIPARHSEHTDGVLNSIGTASVGDIACKHGGVTSKTCGTIFQETPLHYLMYTGFFFGDSGSPVVVGDQLVGLISLINTTAAPPLSMGVVKITSDLAAINAAGSYGAGFTLVP